MALAIDASSPAITAYGSAGTVATSPSFSPPSNSVLYAVSTSSAPPSTSPTATITNTGAVLNWQLLVRDNISTAGLGGTTEVWWAFNTFAQSGITVTSTLSIAVAAHTNEGFIQVLVITGANKNQLSAATNRFNSATSAAPTLSLVTTDNDSMVFGAIMNWTNATGPTIPGTQTSYVQLLNAGDADGNWIQYVTAVTPNPGTTVTVNDTAPICVHHQIVWEILSAPRLQNNYQFFKVGDGMSVSEKLR